MSAAKAAVVFGVLEGARSGASAALIAKGDAFISARAAARNEGASTRLIVATGQRALVQSSGETIAGFLEEGAPSRASLALTLTAPARGWGGEMFGITSAYRFFEKVRGDYACVEADIADPGAALDCILSLYHLHEWVWARWLKRRSDVRVTLGIRRGKGAACGNRRNEGTFSAWLDANCPHFGLVAETCERYQAPQTGSLNRTRCRIRAWPVGRRAVRCAIPAD